MIKEHYRSSLRTSVAVAALSVMALPAAEANAGTIGYMNAGPEYFYQCQLAGVQKRAREVGADLVVVNSESNPQKQLSNGQDLIARGVDVILLESADATTSQRVVELAKDANIPIVIAGISIDIPGGNNSTVKPTTSLTLDFHDMGKLIADWLTENRPDAKLGVIQGLPGQGVTEGIYAGFEDNVGPGITVLANQPADWNRQKAGAVATNMVTANPDIDTLYVFNEDMSAGVLQALDALGRSDIKLVSHNGTDDGVAMLKSERLLATVAQSPVLEGIVSVDLAQKIMSGEQVPEVVPYPLKVVTVDALPLETPFCATAE